MTEACKYFPGLPKLDKVLRALDDLGAFSPSGGVGWELRKLVWYRDAFFELAPFQEGDRVVMHTRYTPVKSDGWYYYRESMFVGATGVVKAMDWTADELQDKTAPRGAGCWLAYIMFDRELTTRDYPAPEIVETPSDRRGHFPFSNPERWFRRAEDPAGEAA